MGDVFSYLMVSWQAQEEMVSWQAVTMLYHILAPGGTAVATTPI